MSAHDGVHAFLTRYGRALVSGDAAAVAECFAVPAMVIRGDAASAVTSRPELVRAFIGLAKRYRDDGLWLPEPLVTRMDRLGEHLVSADVTWTGYAQAGVPNGHVERYSYVLHRDPGSWRIQVAIDLTDAVAGFSGPHSAALEFS